MIVQDDAEISLNPPECIQLSKEKVDLEKVKRDIPKFLNNCRLFDDSDKVEWGKLLSDNSPIFEKKKPDIVWPLVQLVNKKKAQPAVPDTETVEGVAGKRPVGFPMDLEEDLKDQMGPIPEVYEYFFLDAYVVTSNGVQ